MPLIVMVFHALVLDAIGGMIWVYVGPKGGSIFDGQHKCRSFSPQSGGHPSCIASAEEFRTFGSGRVSPHDRATTGRVRAELSAIGNPSVPQARMLREERGSKGRREAASFSLLRRSTDERRS